jgi:hypothetical protein
VDSQREDSQDDTWRTLMPAAKSGDHLSYERLLHDTSCAILRAGIVGGGKTVRRQSRKSSQRASESSFAWRALTVVKNQRIALREVRSRGIRSDVPRLHSNANADGMLMPH